MKTEMKAKQIDRKAKWQGYSYDELMYQRVLTMARIEMTKERLSSNIDRLKHGGGIISGGWIKRIFKILDYSDIFVIGMSIWRKLSPLFSRRR